MTNLDPNVYSAEKPIPTAAPTTSGYTGVSEGYLPPANYMAPAARVEAGLILPPRKVSVPGVVSATGQIQNFYDLNTKPAEILGSLDDISRKKLIDGLYKRGWYGGDKPGAGFDDADRRAVRDLLYYSNVQGRTYDDVLNTVSQAPISQTGAGAAPSYSSGEDLAVIADKTALSTIGRKLSAQERAKFVQSYQGAQKAAGASAGGMQAPSADVFFQNRIQKKYGAETTAYKYLTAMSRVANLLESI